MLFFLVLHQLRPATKVYSEPFRIVPNLNITRADMRARADVAKIQDGLSDFVRWGTFMARANAMGLTQGLDMSRQIQERIQMITMTKKNSFVHADDHLDDDWAAIHYDETTLAVEEEDDESFDVVHVEPDDWDKIRNTAFEVDTQIVYDTVIKGRWTVKDGKCVFEDKL